MSCRVLASWRVAASCGRLAGMTLTDSTAPSGLGCTGPTDATSAVLARALLSAELRALTCADVLVLALSTCTATVKGPLVPTPNPSLMASKAWRLE
ncbi:hypothetical protein [Trebonia kvetii]|uniref:hypothetical protein n=1 Tax=Trebonia kvetii TaxID=2480626 RepID=UPI001C9E5605|nr:hypothetical protein [Trebonia kvetii]